MTREERVRQMAIPVVGTKSSPNRPDWAVKNSAFEEASMSIEDRIRQNAKERIASYLSARNKVVI